MCKVWKTVAKVRTHLGTFRNILHANMNKRRVNKKQFETKAYLEEHGRGVHEHNSTVCAKGAHGVGNTLRQGVACRSMAGVDMWAVEVDVQAVGKCFRNRDT